MAALREAVDMEILGAVPPKPKMEKIPETEAPWLTWEDQMLVIDHAPRKFRAILLVLACQGVRVSEAINLTWEQIDRKRQTVCIDIGKTKKENNMPLHSVFLQYLKDNKIYGLSGKVFLETNQNAIWLVVTQACRDAGIRVVNTHQFSVHSWVSQRLNAGFTLDQISKTNRKSRRIMESTYGHGDNEMKRRVVEG